MNPHVLSDTSPSNSRGCRYTTWARDTILRGLTTGRHYLGMRIFRCPRCRAEDISADAHPTRVLDNGVERPVFVCRNCYRAAELEFRIASHTADRGYVPLAIRDGLRRLRDFYRERLAERDGDDARVRAALEDVERRLAIDAV